MQGSGACQEEGSSCMLRLFRSMATIEHVFPTWLTERPRDENENNNFRFLEIIFEFFFRFSGLNKNSSGKKNENDNDKNNRKRIRKQFCLIPTVFEDCRI